jgi:hypothetical protein
VPFKQDKALAFEGKGILVQLVEKENTIGDLDGKLRVFSDIVMTEIPQATIDDAVGDL